VTSAIIIPMINHYFKPETTLACTIDPIDSAAMRTMLLRLKRILLRNSTASATIKDLVKKWEDGVNVHGIEIPMPDGWWVYFRSHSFRSLALFIEASDISVEFNIFPVQATDYRHCDISDLLYVGLHMEKPTAFGDSEIVGELMEFLHDYTDYKEMVDE